MTKREAAIVSAYTGYLIGDVDDWHKYVQEILGRPVFTHELASKSIQDEVHDKSRDDFCNIKITTEELPCNVDNAVEIFGLINKLKEENTALKKKLNKMVEMPAPFILWDKFSNKYKVYSPEIGMMCDDKYDSFDTPDAAIARKKEKLKLLGMTDE